MTVETTIKKIEFLQKEDSFLQIVQVWIKKGNYGFPLKFLCNKEILKDDPNDPVVNEIKNLAILYMDDWYKKNVREVNESKT